MTGLAQIPLTIYTESTPNPETMKYVMNRMLTQDIREYKNVEETGNSPLATALFGFPFIKGVFFSNNFVTITKTTETSWDDVMLEIKEYLRQYIQSEKPIFNTTESTAPKESMSADDTEDIAKIKQLLDTYVKPAVEMDGGNIIFRSYQDGIVTLGMQGSCSGCPSSTITLKSGIEGLLKRMMPEIKEVVAEAM